MSKRRRLLISFSGGETSAFMTLLLLRKYACLYDEVVVLFANTSQEREECLVFVDRCDRELFAPLGHRVVYVEAVQSHGQRKRADHRVVTFETACRDGSVFEDMILKYGIPNAASPHCTRDLKLSAINSYVKSLGWSNDNYETAIGIRADETDRMNANPKDGRRIIYPLISWEPTRKPQVNAFWSQMPFRLELKGYEGNCKWCWKKSLRKHITLARENPSHYEFPMMMELMHGTVGPEFKKDTADMREKIAKGYRRTFFRGGSSAIDMITLGQNPPENWTPAEDDAQVYDVELDTAGGCGESCEVFADYEEQE